MGQATEPAQITVMTTKIAPTVMQASGLDRSVIFWQDARRLVQPDDAALHSLPVWPARGASRDWAALHHMTATSHAGVLAVRAEARGHRTVDGRHTRDANGQHPR